MFGTLGQHELSTIKRSSRYIHITDWFTKIKTFCGKDVDQSHKVVIKSRIPYTHESLCPDCLHEYIKVNKLIDDQSLTINILISRVCSQQYTINKLNKELYNVRRQNSKKLSKSKRIRFRS